MDKRILLFTICQLSISCCFSELSNVSNGSRSRKEPISILTLLPYYSPNPTLNPFFVIGDDVRPAMELAKMQINENQNMLENYTIELVYARAGCEILTTTSTSLVEEAFKPNRSKLAGIIGPSCSSSTMYTASLTGRPELGLVTVHGSGSHILSNRTEYKYLLGPLGTTDVFVDKFILLVNETKWKRVSILYDNSNIYYTETQSRLVDKLKEVKVKVEFLSAISTTFLPLDGVLHAQTPIVFVLGSLGLTHHVICSAKMTLVYQKYQWVFMESMFEELSIVNNDTIPENCTREDILKLLENSFLLNHNFEEKNQTLLVSNITFSEYREAYSERIQQYNREMKRARNSTYSHWAGIFYDAVWAWGLVLDNLTKSMENFDAVGDSGYGNLNRSDALLEQFYQNSFQGASGKIEFDRETGYSQREIDVYHIVNGSPRLLRFDKIDDNFIDVVSDTFKNETIREHKLIGIVFSIVAIFQVCIAGALQVATVVLRERPSVKASSFRLLHISYFGIYVISLVLITRCLHSALYPSSDPESMKYICILFWTWLLPIGFTLSFGPVAMRTWRVYRIFKHYLDPGPFIRDSVLIGGIGILLFIDVTIATVWTVANRFYVDYDTNEYRPYIIQPTCKCKHIKWWFSVIYTYKIAILIAVTVFSLLTRDIQNRSFTSASQCVLVYLVTAEFLIGFSLYYILLSAQPDNPNYSSVILYLTLTLIVAVFILCIFIPPLRPVAEIKSRLKSEYTKHCIEQRLSH